MVNRAVQLILSSSYQLPEQFSVYEGLIIWKLVLALSSDISQVVAILTNASSILGSAEETMVSPLLYRSVLSSGNGSENAVCSPLKTMSVRACLNSWIFSEAVAAASLSRFAEYLTAFFAEIFSSFPEFRISQSYSQDSY
jgi:hypothetical protein